MFEVLVFMFEHYIAHRALPETAIMTQELSAAGFEQSDIAGAFDWFHIMKSRLVEPSDIDKHQHTSMRIFSDSEYKKISLESISFLIFLQQANVINHVERDLIVDRAMALEQAHINIAEMRWITMIALWNAGREKDYLFVEDALFNPRGLTLH